MASASKVRGGFTLVEVIVALVLLSSVALMMGAVVARLSSASARDGSELRAVELVKERIAQVSGDPGYNRLETRYAGTEAAATLGGYTRTTAIQRVLQNGAGGAMLDYKIVDVQVRGPGVNGTVARRVIVAAP